VHRFIDEIIERSLSDRERRGCFLINSALEVAPPRPRGWGVLIADRLGEIESILSAVRFAAAQGRWNCFHPIRSPGDLARFTARRAARHFVVLARSKPERALARRRRKACTPLYSIHPRRRSKIRASNGRPKEFAPHSEMTEVLGNSHRTARSTLALRRRPATFRHRNIVAAMPGRPRSGFQLSRSNAAPEKPSREKRANASTSAPGRHFPLRLGANKCCTKAPAGTRVNSARLPRGRLGGTVCRGSSHHGGV